MSYAQQLNARLPYLFGDELDYFAKLGASLPDKARVVILGMGPGVMAIALLESNPTLDTIGIDCCDSTGIKHIRDAGFEAHFLEGYTVGPLSSLIASASLDLLVVDANHTYEAVVADVLHWYPKLKSGGLLFFHDFVPHERDAPDNGVKRAVEYLITVLPMELVETPGISAVFRIKYGAG